MPACEGNFLFDREKKQRYIVDNRQNIDEIDLSIIFFMTKEDG